MGREVAVKPRRVGESTMIEVHRVTPQVEHS